MECCQSAIQLIMRYSDFHALCFFLAPCLLYFFKNMPRECNPSGASERERNRWAQVFEALHIGGEEQHACCLERHCVFNMRVTASWLRGCLVPGVSLNEVCPFAARFERIACVCVCLSWRAPSCYIFLWFQVSMGNQHETHEAVLGGSEYSSEERNTAAANWPT